MLALLLFHGRKNKALLFDTFVFHKVSASMKPSTSLLRIFADPPTNKKRLN